MAGTARDPLAALATLLRLKSTGGLQSSSDVAEPSEAELVQAQATPGVGTFSTPERTMKTSAAPWSLGGGGSAVEGTSTMGGTSSILSRQALKEEALQRAAEERQTAEEAGMAKLRQLVLPEQVKGQYRVQAAGETARAAESRAASSQAATDARQREMIAALGGRQDKTIAAQGARQEDQQTFKSGQVSPTALSAIARERQAVAARVAKTEPGAVMKFMGRANPQQAELATFDSALKAAQLQP